jgi:tetratricopeptide (TPR) repeat protein
MQINRGRVGGTDEPMRNGPCPCGSGEKYKRCCGAAARQASAPAAATDGRQLLQQGAKLLRSGQAEAALTPLLAAIQAGEAEFEAYHLLATALTQTGRIGEAAAILTHAVTLRPDSAVGYRDLGTAFDRQNQHDQAIDAYRRAVELDPKLGDVQLRLGQLYAIYSLLDEAADCFDRAADAKPKTALAHMCRSDAAMLRGHFSEAEQWARRAIAVEPKNCAALSGLASLLTGQGKFDEAAGYYEQALRINPKADKAWDGLVHCRKFGAADGAVLERMGAVLRRGDLHAAEAMSLHFSIGKVHDDRGEYAQAMQNFDAANRLRGQGVSFDRAAFAAAIDRTIAVYTADFVARAAESGTRTEKPLFVVGMYRSGTTLVEQILSSHPDVTAGGELAVWGPEALEIDPATGDFAAARTQADIARYLARLDKIGPGAARVTDKLPANFLRLGAIHALLPDARIIHCERDPIDVCLSIYTNLFNARLPFAARKGDLVFYYQQYKRMMQHWRNVLPAATLLDVQYEQVVGDREAQTRRMIAFAGLDWHEACLLPEQNSRAIGTVSAWQARQPVYATSLQRWRRYEPWLGELRQLTPAV